MSVATVMPVRTASSGHTRVRGNPSIITLRTAPMYHRAGTTAESHWSGRGAFSTGNIMPDSRIVGSIIETKATIMAATCVRTSVEIRSPIDRAKTM